MQRINRMNQTKLTDEERKEFEIIPVIIAEDISGAFESIHHKNLTKALERMLKLHHLSTQDINMLDTNIISLAESYLDRTAYVCDSNGMEQLKSQAGRSTPQGSSLSPKLIFSISSIFRMLMITLQY